MAHDLIYNWLPHAASALIIFDQDAGYRSFLGADPVSAHAPGDLCDDHVTFTESFVTSPEMQAFGETLSHILQPKPANPQPLFAGLETPATEGVTDLHAVLRFESHRFHPDMLDWTADHIAALVHNEGVPPGEIVVLAPFLTDALRFSLTHRLAQRDVPARSHRPSRALRDEPATRTLLTWSALAHPLWGIAPTKYDVAYALMQTIADLDLVRAQLLADVLYRKKDGAPELTTFDGINPEMQQRITYIFGGRYEALRIWLKGYIAGSPTELDHFLARLFGEVLSQSGYGFHQDFDAARVAAMLIESVQKFRWIVAPSPAVSKIGEERGQGVPGDGAGRRHRGAIPPTLAAAG